MISALTYSVCVFACVGVQHCFPLYSGGVEVQGVEGMLKVEDALMSAFILNIDSYY
jgi:hypothetical protein